MTQMVLTIDGRRDAYSVEQIMEHYTPTMTVGQLIDYLGQYDDDTPVMINNDNGYTYGYINESSFREEEYEDYEDEEEEE